MVLLLKGKEYSLGQNTNLVRDVLKYLSAMENGKAVYLLLATVADALCNAYPKYAFTHCSISPRRRKLLENIEDKGKKWLNRK